MEYWDLNKDCLKDNFYSLSPKLGRLHHPTSLPLGPLLRSHLLGFPIFVCSPLRWDCMVFNMMDLVEMAEFTLCFDLDG